MTRVLFLFYFIFLLSSCRKAEERTCWKTAGKSSYQRIEIQDSFKGIAVYDNIDLELVRDSVDYLEVYSYEHLSPFISAEIVDSLLTIKDKNRCNFLRKYKKKTTIKVHFREISVLKLLGDGYIRSLNTIENEVVHIYAHSANSTVNLTVKATSLVVKLVNGTVDGRITGSATSAEIYHYGMSKVDFQALHIDYLSLVNKSDADVTVNVQNEMKLRLLSLGNVYYYGSPTILVIENSENSKIIKLE